MVILLDIDGVVSGLPSLFLTTGVACCESHVFYLLSDSGVYFEHFGEDVLGAVDEAGFHFEVDEGLLGEGGFGGGVFWT